MKWIKSRKYRLWAALAAGIASVLLSVAVPDAGEMGRSFMTQDTAVMSWWETLYPKFCFAKNNSPKDFSEDVEKDDVKISFWLAKVLGW